MVARFTPRFDAARIEQMQSILQQSTLPEISVASPEDVSSELGVDLEWLKDAKHKLENYNVKALEEKINEFRHFKADVEGCTVHFIHEESSRPNAIPLLILHGWPGTVFDFHKIIKRLAHPENPSHPAFHVVAPSLPGFGWSSLPRQKEFSIDDIARLFNKLMTDVLQYKKYFAQGGDWGSHILRTMGKSHHQNVPLILFNMFYAPAPGVASYLPPFARRLPLPRSIVSYFEHKTMFWGLTGEEATAVRRRIDFGVKGSGYSAIAATKPATIGYAIGASPLSLLAYIGEKFLAWSDPALVDIENLLATVTIYYLTDSFSTSVMIYNQSLKQVMSLVSSQGAWGEMKSTIGYSHFPYEIEASPESWIRLCANVVRYTRHSSGGHFPALDNPDALIGDIRTLVSNHWAE